MICWWNKYLVDDQMTYWGKGKPDTWVSHVRIVFWRYYSEPMSAQ